MRYVHFIITGIVALVPRKSGGIRVIVPNLSHHPTLPHLGHLLIDKAYVPTGRLSNATLIHPRTGAAIGYWQLMGDEITIGNTLLDPPTIDYANIASLPDILGVSGGVSDIAPGIVNSLDPALVAARMDFAQGKLVASWVGTNSAWTFKLSTGTYGPIFLAQEVCVTSSIAEDQLQLTVTRFGGSSYPLSVKANGDGRFEVRLGNLDGKLVLPNVKKPPTAKTDIDFTLYYDLAQYVNERPAPEPYPKPPSFPPPPPLPAHVPQETHLHSLNLFTYPPQFAVEDGQMVVTGPPTGGVGGVNCPPALFNLA